MSDRPDTTRTISDQVINRRLKDQIVPKENMELDNYLDSIDSELKQPLRLKASVDGSYQVEVQSILIRNPETEVERSRFPIKKKIPTFASQTISFPNTSGNPVLVSAGLSENLVLGNDKYCKFLVQVDDQGQLLLRQGFEADTAELAEIPKAKSGLTSIGYITLHMGIGGVLDLVTEKDITQFDGHNDTQDFKETLRVREHRPNYKKVEISGGEFDGSDDNKWIRTLEGKKLDFSGALIDFETGIITTEDGVTPLGTNFSVPTIPDTFWQWFSVNLEPVTQTGANQTTAKVTVIPASSPGTTLANAPQADWVDHNKGIRLAQVAVQGSTVGGGVEQPIYSQANINQDIPILESGEYGQTFEPSTTLNVSKAELRIGNGGLFKTQLQLTGMANAQYNQTYQQVDNAGTRTTAGPNFVSDNAYKIYSFDAGGGVWYVVIRDNDLINDWAVYETNSDPATWVNAQSITLNSSESITNSDEIQGLGQNAPDSADANVTYSMGGVSTGTIKFQIFDTTAGFPSGVAIAESVDVDLSTLPNGLATAVASTEIPLITPVALFPGNTYSFVWTINITNDGNMSFGVDNTDPYAQGEAQFNDPVGGWEALNAGGLDAIAIVTGETLGTPAIENIFDATIVHQTELSSEGEGRRFGVANVQALKDTAIYERHHHMLRLVESDLQGRGVLYRWDEFDTSPDTTGSAETGEAAKVLEPTDGIGRWLTITAMDVGESVIRTDMLRDDNVTLDKLAHTDPHRVIGFNAGGVPSYLFELELTDGTPLQPTYSFALDQDTGWYRHGDGQIAWSSNGVRKFLNSPGTDDIFEYGTGTTSKNQRLRVTSLDGYESSIEAVGFGTAGSGRLFVGESIQDGGGIYYNGDGVPATPMRTDAVAHYRREAGSDAEVFWYRRTNDNVHFNGCIALRDNDGTEPNPETGYLALCHDNNSLFMKTSTGTVINIPNQSEADARYLRRNASDTPSADNTWNLGTASLRWANIYAVTFQGRATSANYADLAERYEADMELEPGEVVKLGGSKEITKTTSAKDTQVFGIVSTDPAFRMNDNEGDDDKTKPFVALAGRVPCKVIGKVKKGQRLCSSDIDGVAQALDESVDNWKIVIGRALEDKDAEGIGKIEVVVGTK